MLRFIFCSRAIRPRLTPLWPKLRSAHRCVYKRSQQVCYRYQHFASSAGSTPPGDCRYPFWQAVDMPEQAGHCLLSFFLQNRSAFAPLFPVPPFRKRSRLLRRWLYKRDHNARAAPPFCEFYRRCGCQFPPFQAINRPRVSPQRVARHAICSPSGPSLGHESSKHGSKRLSACSLFSSSNA